MKRPNKSIGLNLVAVVAGVLLFAGTLLLVHNADIFGSPFFFVMGLVAELIILAGIVYNLYRILKSPMIVAYSLAKSVWRGVRTNEYVRALVKRESPVVNWLRARFDHQKPTGWLLTKGVLGATGFLYGFTGILQDVIFHDPLTKFDTRVVNMVPFVRTPMITGIFRFFTMTCNYQSVILLTVLVVLLLWSRKKRVAAELFLLAVAVEESVVFGLKHLIGRVRPERALGIIAEDSYSFPSGHAMIATLVWGLLFYYIYKSLKSSAGKFALVLGYLLFVIMVAISRVYLGVHFPSDVMASIFLGGAILTVFITFAEISSRFGLWRQSKESFGERYLFFAPLVLLIFALLVNSYFVKIRVVSVQQKTVTIDRIDAVSVHKLPLYSETLIGNRMEPINFVYIGSREQITALFTSHGWYQADPSTIDNTLKAFALGFRGEQYLTAPVTPSYLDAKPETMAFQHPTAKNSLSQRHHTRLWQTNYAFGDGREIWVATASFDDRIEFAGPARLLPTHHIDANIDAERQYILDSLGVENANLINVVGPQTGKNAAGDSFFTDGKAAVVDLKPYTD